MTAGMQRVERDIREAARRLFAEGKIDLLLGYERGTLPFRSRPLFLTAADVGAASATGGPAASAATAPGTAAVPVRPGDPLERLVWDSFCAANLAAFLPRWFERNPMRRGKGEEPRPRIGLVAKGCDLRSAVSLVRERQAPRANLMLIGVPCRGMIDRGKTDALLAGRGLEGWRETEEGLELTLRDGTVQTAAREELLQEACRQCRFPRPEGADLSIEGRSREPAAAEYPEVDAFASLPARERWARFEAEIARCIRCNACRQACPNCWCRECFAEQTDLCWIGASTERSDTMLFHLVRIYHQAGRCVGCDACLRACPVGVDLRPFTRKIVKDVEELFGYLPGFSAEETAPLSTFREDDSEAFISDPEGERRT
jgi:ferredoxin